jgi:hypothetical protein
MMIYIIKKKHPIAYIYMYTPHITIGIISHVSRQENTNYLFPIQSRFVGLFINIIEYPFNVYIPHIP